MRLATTLIEGNRPFAEDEGGKDHGTEATYAIVESLRNFLNKGNVKALMSMGDAWKRAFSVWVARVDPQYKKACPEMEVLDNIALTLKSVDAGAVKDWVHLLLHTQTGKTSPSKSRSGQC